MKTNNTHTNSIAAVAVAVVALADTGGCDIFEI